MFEDLMHLTASLDLRAQSERCVSTIIFYACASSGVAGGGYAAAICGRAPLEKVRQAHTGPSTRSVRDMRMSEKVAPTTLSVRAQSPFLAAGVSRARAACRHGLRLLQGADPDAGKQPSSQL